MIPLLIVVGLLLLSALFSSSELAIMGVPLYKIKKYINQQKGSKNWRVANILLSLREKGERTLIAILIGNNLVNVFLSIYAASLGDTILGNFALSGAIGFFLVSFIITFLILFFGEIIPKVFATKYALSFALKIAPLIQGIIYLLYPIVRILEKVIFSLNSILGSQEEKVSKEDIEIFVEEGRKQGIFSSVESLIIHNLLEFRKRNVESVFTHRTNVFALSRDITLKEAVDKILQNPHSRIPLYDNDKDNIVRLLTLRKALDLYVANNDNHTKLLREFSLPCVTKIPITASIFDVFLDMKKGGWHFAVVIDEYGGTAGIVTLEDLLEDLVGDIRDEVDENEERSIIKIDEQTLKVKGDVILRDIVDVLGLMTFKIPENIADDISEEDTVSYIILHQLKDFAKIGDMICVSNLCLEVLRTNSTGEKIEEVGVSLREQ